MAQTTLVFATLTLCAALNPAHATDQGDNPFALQALSDGYLLAEGPTTATAPATLPAKKSPEVANRGDAVDNKAARKKKPKTVEAKCGEGKCGGNAK